MRFTPTKALYSLVVLIIISTSVFSQESKESKDQKELKKKAITILEGVVTESASLPRVLDQAFVQLSAGVLLWNHDEPRARAFINNAKEQFMSIKLPAEPTDVTDYFRLEREPQAISKLRSGMIRFVVAHDIAFAIELYESTEIQKNETVPDDPEKAKYGYDHVSFEENKLAAELASKAARSNPKFASEIALKLLKNSSTQNFNHIIDIWKQLRLSDLQISETLAVEMIQNGKSSESVNHNYMGMDISVLSTWAGIIKTDADKSAAKSKDKPPPLSSTEQRLFRELLDKYVSEVAKLTEEDLEEHNNPSGGMLLSALNTLMPHIQKLYPSRAATLKKQKVIAKYLAEKPLETNPNYMDWYNSEFQAELDKKTVAEILKLAETADHHNQDLLQKAFEKALQNGDLIAAEKIKVEHLIKTTYSKEANKKLELSKIKASIPAANDEESIKTINTIKNAEDRFKTLIEYANNHLKKNNKESARRYLDAAIGMVGSNMRNYKHVYSQMLIATTLVELDYNHSLDITAALIDRLDYLLTNVKELIIFVEMDSMIPYMSDIGFDGAESKEFDPVTELFLTQSAKDIDRTFANINRAQNTDASIMLKLFLLYKILH